MNDTQDKHLESHSTTERLKNPDPGDTGSVAGKNGLETKTNVTASKTSKAAFILAAVSLCTLLGLAGFWFSEWQRYKEHTRKLVDEIQAEIGDMRSRLDAGIGEIRTDITDVRSLVDASVKEEIICLKIHVLQRKVSNETAREIAAAVYKYARIYEREPDLILAIMKVESNFAPEIESRMGAIGLMQVMPQWIDVLGIDCSLKDPDCNTRYGLQILGAYELLYGSLDMALTAYNRGPGPVDAALMRGKNPDNGYPAKVNAVYERLRQLSR